MKKIVKIAVYLVFVCLLQGQKVEAQSVTLQFAQISSLSDDERLKDLILRKKNEWSAAGYTIMSYAEFKDRKPLPSEIMDRFQQNLLFYANKEIGGESTSFVIYKREIYGLVYELQVLEDTAGQAFPNKFTRADTYTDR